MYRTGFSKIAIAALGLTVGLCANTIEAGQYLQGLKYYEAGEYDKAFPLILEEATEKANKAAQYRLAEMYEQGRGTKVDYKKASIWYKKAASKYSFVEKKEFGGKADESFSSRLSEQFGQDSAKAGAEFALAKMDTSTPETKAMLTSLLDGDFFGLKPYGVNYILPLSYSKDKPRRVSSLYPMQDLAGTPYAEYNENTEVVFQLSLKKELSFNLFGWDEYITAAYTQKVWWQLYDESGPFRETNYQPEIFMTIPTSQSLDDSIGLKAVKLGFIHESNGQEGYRSRSWNRLYATGMWQWGNLFLSTRAWYRITEDAKSDAYYNGETPPAGDPNLIQAESDGDDNPDIHNYLGYGDIKLNYLYNKHQFGLMVRNNLRFDSDNRGAVEFTYSYPLFDSPNTNWYFKAFNGYGESLIDYNVDVTKVSFGFSFSNGLF
ncbi:phospholipase A [Sulfurovum sp.]|uniref:phospholipase A n=1 Tax=Sulfurovum sp. TaxID=1969726 RepID=UPI003565F31B